MTEETCAELGKRPTVLRDGGCQGCSTARVNGAFVGAGVTAALASTAQPCLLLDETRGASPAGWAFYRSYFSFYGYILLFSTSITCSFLEAPGFALPQAEVTVLMGTPGCGM